MYTGGTNYLIKIKDIFDNLEKENKFATHLYFSNFPKKTTCLIKI